MLNVKVPSLATELEKEKNFKLVTIENPDELLDRGFTEEGIAAIGKNCGIPAGYLKKLYGSNKDLFNDTIKHWMSVVDTLTKKTIAIKDEKVAGLCKQDTILVPTDRVIDNISAVFDKNGWDGDLVQSAIHPNDSFLSVIFNDVQKNAVETAERGDLLNAGFSLVHSMLGDFKDRMISYVHRLVCSNGLIVDDEQHTWDISDYTFPDVIEDCICQARDTGMEIMDKFVALKNISVTNPVSAITSMAKQMGIGAKDINLLLQEVGRQPLENMYDVSNLLTYFATHQSDDPYEVRKRQIRAGHLITVDVCDHCHSVVEHINKI